MVCRRARTREPDTARRESGPVRAMQPHSQTDHTRSPNWVIPLLVRSPTPITQVLSNWSRTLLTTTEVLRYRTTTRCELHPLSLQTLFRSQTLATRLHSIT